MHEARFRSRVGPHFQRRRCNVSCLQNRYPGLICAIYRVRSLLARLTSSARTLPILNEFKVADTFNFLDLLKLLGFKQVTVSDGVAFSHQIKLK